MRRSRRYRQGWLILPALLLSAAVEGGGIATYEATRPPPTWSFALDLAGEGTGQVLIQRAGSAAPQRCDHGRCAQQLHLGDEVTLIAVPAQGATFEGFGQLPLRTPAFLHWLLGDPLAKCVFDDLSDLVGDASARNALECKLTITADVNVEAAFGLVPEEQDVAIVQTPALALPPGVKLPEPKPITPVEAEKLEDKPIELAVVPPPPPLPQIIKPPPPPPPEAAKKPPQPPPPNMTMVEVPDQKESDKAPDDATKLSDKNRDTEEETRATETNLDKQLDGENKASAKSDDTTSPDVGAQDDKIAHVEETVATSDEARDTSDHSGQSDHAEGAKVGDAGDDGQSGTGPSTPGMMSMREIGGRGDIVDQAPGDGKKRGHEGAPGVKTQLAFNDYERIVGKDKADKERDIGKQKLSAHKGRYEAKLEAIRSSLENFTPDVRPGNQTALKTRANPFAVYVARMHRKIHERWGFGFLEDLDSKPASSPMNNFDLYVMIEISIDPDGTVHKTTIAKTSGVLEFDVAALDAVISSGPYEATPEAIQSVDKRVYMRWGFYRNWRQCGTFNVEPYILTDIPGGIEPIGEHGAVASDTHSEPVTPMSDLEGEPASPTSSVSDAKALYAANLWVSGFAQADIQKMTRFSTVPFSAGGQVAAQTTKDLEDMYKGLIVESGPLRDWKLMTAAEYGAQAAGDALVLQVRTSKETFAVVLQKTNSGEFRAVQIVR
ncbi:MAG TPA: energy transducer TonB [Kofleriaceae bacterium]|nr:energy transducer TonB [Kofleriaceae bacterium]